MRITLVILSIAILLGSAESIFGQKYGEIKVTDAEIVKSSYEAGKNLAIKIMFANISDRQIENVSIRILSGEKVLLDDGIIAVLRPKEEIEKIFEFKSIKISDVKLEKIILMINKHTWYMNLTPTVAKGQKIYYANKINRDFVGTAPWRINNVTTSLPYFIAIKDADEQKAELQKVTVSVEINGSYKNVYSEPFNSSINSSFWSRSITQFLNSDFPGKDGKIITPGELGFSFGETIKTKIHIGLKSEFDPDEIFLQTYVGMPLPNDNGNHWYYGDTHYHSSYTDNFVEFGMPLAATKMAAEAMGLHWITVTDHSNDLFRSTEVNPVTVDQTIWNRQKNEISNLNSEGGLKLVQAEEVSVHASSGRNASDNANPLKLSNEKEEAIVHILVYNYSALLPGRYTENEKFPLDGWLGGAFKDQFFGGVLTLQEVEERIRNSGDRGATFIFAAHPEGIGETQGKPYENQAENGAPGWDNNDYSDPLIMGLELWNEKVTKKYQKSSVHLSNPWDDWNEVDRWYEKGLEPGIHRWDELMHSGLTKTPLRKYFMSAGTDAHGDFNYATRPDLLHGDYATDNALGKIRTAVYLENTLGTKGENAVSALRYGRAVVTDGPLVYMEFDKNGDGSIDARMGKDIAIAPNVSNVLIIKGESNSEFGNINAITLHVGDVVSASRINNPEILSLNRIGTKIEERVNIIEKLPPSYKGWCFFRISAFTDKGYRCYSNPIWFNVGSVNRAPSITSTANITGTVDVAYSYDVNASDPDGDKLIYSLVTKP